MIWHNLQHILSVQQRGEFRKETDKIRRGGKVCSDSSGLLKNLAKFLLLFSLIMECHDSSYHVQNIPIVNIKERETLIAHDVRRTGIPRSIIVRMDQLEPVNLQL